MNRQRRSAPAIGSRTSLTSHQWEGLKLLRAAADTASGLGQDRWQFAVEIEQLHAAGLSNTGLRRLLCLGYIEHGQESTLAGAGQHIFQPLRTLILPQRTCFVITPKGQEVVSVEGADQTLGAGLRVMGPPEVPRWDGEARQSWWQGFLIKEFRRPAANQETVLAAFEEEGWPMRINDPLPRTADIDPKARLHDTIKNLNRHRQHQGIYFRGDGSGWGVRWVIAGSE
jgi:hypothetical protein